MANAVIGALRVVLGADTGAYEDALKRSQAQLSSFGANAAKAGAAIGAAIVASGSAIALGLSHAIENMDKLSKQSQKIGIPVEELSKLKLAAQLSDVSMESLGSAVARFSKNLVEATGKATTPAARAFSALGISIKDSSGQIRPTADLIKDVAGKFESFEDGATKTALAIALFGRAGADLIPLLNSGKDGLKLTADEAQRFGLVISKEAGKAAEDFRDNLTRLTAAKQGLFIIMSERLLPSLVDFSTRLVEGAKDAENMRGSADTLGRAAAFVVDNFELLAKAIAKLNPLTSVLSGAASGLRLIGEQVAKILPGDGLQRFNDFLTSTGVNTRALTAGISKLAEEDNKFTEQAKKRQAPKIASEEEIRRAEQLREKIAALGLQSRALKGDFDSLAPGFVEAVNGMKLLKDNAAALTMTADELRNKFPALNQALLQFKGNQLVFENREPLVAWRAEMALVEMAMKSVGATSEEIARAMEKHSEKFGMTWAQIGGNIAGTAGALSSLTGTFAKENKAMGIASKAFGIGQAIINTQIAITKALATLPPPASYAAATFAVAQGAAAIAAISMQQFAMGGKFFPGGRVGGSGGVDSQLVQFMASPDERVTVEPQGRDMRGGGGEVTIKGVNTREFFRGDAVRDLIEAVKEAVSDGHSIRFA